MADKTIVDKIKRQDETRAARLLELMPLNAEDIATGLELLVTDYRTVAEWYIEAKVRGGKSFADDYRATAAKLQLLAIALRKAPSPAPARQLPVAWCGQHHDHGPHDWPLSEPAGPERSCSGYDPKTAQRRTGLEALIAESPGVAGQPATATEPSAFLKAVQQAGTPATHHVTVPGGPGNRMIPLPPLTAAAGDTIVVSFDNSGATFTPHTMEASSVEPVFIDPGEPFTETMFAAPAPPEGTQADIDTRHDDPAPDLWAYETAMASAAAGRTQAHVHVPTFTDPVGPGARDVPGARLTWGDLTEMVGKPLDVLGLPEHVSHSQIGTLDDCGVKYAATRSEALGVVEVPQWSHVGGNAVHRFVEWFELLIAEVKTAQYVTDRMTTAGGLEAVWKRCFAEVVGDTALANPLMTMDTWRASRKGLEGYTWWLINGQEMAAKYAAARLAELEQPWRTVRYGDFQDAEAYGVKPMIEYEYEFDVDGVPFKGIIDQVWDVTADHGPMRAGDILVDDAKSGATVPGDTAQLGEYALWLSRLARGAAQDKRIWGRFYDARKGTWSEPIDLLERHPWERFAFEVKAADARKRSGVFTPRPSSFCSGCPVKHACPIFALAPSPAPAVSA